jgi:hypothetical protein
VPRPAGWPALVLVWASAVLAQTPAEITDDKLREAVRLACEGRITIRRQAAERALQGGERIVPMVRAYAQASGRNRLSPSLVRGLGQIGTDGAHELLLEWLADASFFWRPEAIRALGEQARDGDWPLLHGLADDEAPVTRRAALDALAHYRDKAREQFVNGLADADARVRIAAARALCTVNDDRGLPVLVEALRLDHEFFGDPLGLRARSEAFEVVRAIAGEGFGFQPEGDAGPRHAAVQRFETWARERLGDDYRLPEAARVVPDLASYACGVELRTCNLGEMWVRLETADRIAVGVERPERIVIRAKLAAAIRELAARTPDGGSRVFGQVLCDYERLSGLGAERNHGVQAAPGQRPADWAALPEAFAAALAEAGREDLAAALRARAKVFARP